MTWVSVTYDGLTEAQIDEMVNLFDADSAYTNLKNQGMYEAAEYLAKKYFDNE